MRNMVAVLKPFSSLTDGLSGEKMVTVSSVLPLITHVVELCKTPDHEEDEMPDEAAASMEKTLHDSISKYVLSK